MKRFIRQAYISYKALYSYMNPKIYLMMMIINPSLQLIYFAYMVRFAYGTNDISPWIIGNAFLLASSNCIFIIGTLIRRERMQGTLQYVIASPANDFKVFMTRSILHLIDIFVRVVLGFLLGILFFNFQIHNINIIKLLITILAGMFSGFSFGIFVGSISLVVTDVHLFLNTMEQVLILFTGALFSIDKLPDFCRWLPKILPLTRSIKAARMLLNQVQIGFYSLIIEELILGCTFLLLGYAAFWICQFIARKEGSLSLY